MGVSLQNTGFGIESLAALTSGSYNTAVGYDAFGKLSTGSRNTAFGRSSGKNLTTGSNNIYIGYSSGNTSSATSDNEIVIGTGAIGNGDDTVTIGNSDTTSVYLGYTGSYSNLITNDIVSTGKMFETKGVHYRYVGDSPGNYIEGNITAGEMKNGFVVVTNMSANPNNKLKLPTAQAILAVIPTGAEVGASFTFRIGVDEACVLEHHTGVRLISYSGSAYAMRAYEKIPLAEGWNELYVGVTSSTTVDVLLMGNYSITEVPDDEGENYATHYDGSAFDTDVDGYVNYGNAAGWSGVNDGVTEN